MKSQKLKVLAALSLALSIFISCQKSSDTATSRVHLNEAEIELKSWYKSVKPSLSDTVQSLTKAKLDGLDYSTVRVVNQPKLETKLYFIRTAWHNESYSEYLSFAKIDDRYETVGIVRVTKRSAERELANIERFVTIGNLEADFKLMFYGLNKMHFATYEGIAGNGLKTVKMVSDNKSSKNELSDIVRKNESLNERTSGCTDWYMVTTYTYADGTQYQEEVYITTTCEGSGCQASDPNGQNMECINPGEGGGGNGDIGTGGNDYPDNGKLSCSSFSFRGMTSNMYEAGVSGLQFVMDIAGGGSITHNFRNIYVGFPSNTANGTRYSAGEAAAITAYAMNKAGMTMSITYFGMTTTQASAITTTQLENEFKNLVRFYINQEINAGSTVSFFQSGTNTITRPAVWNSSFEQLWNGLTGSGCK